MDEEKLKNELEKWEREIALNPENAVAYFKKGNVLYALGRKEEALASYDKTMKINPNKEEVYYNRGIVLSNLGRNEEALDSLDNALKINPNNNEVYCNRGVVLSKLGRKKEALDSYDNALKINPSDDKVYYNRGNVLFNLGRKKEALDSYDNALKINPNNDKVYCNRGSVLSDLGRNEEALESYDNALKIDPNNDKIHYNQGNVLSDLGRKEEALNSYNKALKINPNNDEVYCNKGVVLFDLGRKEEALINYKKSLKDYNTALKINADDSTLLVNKGMVLSNLGKHKEALKCYIQAIETNKNNKIAQQKRKSLIGSQQFWESFSGNSLIDLWSGDDDFNTLASREKLKGCSSKDLSCIHRLWVEQYRLLYLLSADLEHVGHYTSSTVFETLLQEERETKGIAVPLQLCSVAAANDPMEGTVFLSLLHKDCMPFQRIHSNLAVLQTSFSSSIDSLNQFRLYGKNNGEEGTGLCLVFKQSFFAGPGETSMIAVKRDHEQSSEEEVVTCRKLPLYWVLYYDRYSGHIYYTPACTEHSLDKKFEMTKTSLKESDLKKVEDIGKSLKRIRNHFKAISKEYQQTALEMLIYLRHLVKDAAFKDEKELRILSLHPYHDQGSLLKVLPGKNCLSVDYLPVIHEGEEYLEKVIAGPKLRDFANLVDVAKFRLHHLGGRKKVEFFQSQAPLS